MIRFIDMQHIYVEYYVDFNNYIRGFCNKSNTMGSTSGAGTICPSGEFEFIHVFRRVCIDLYVVVW